MSRSVLNRNERRALKRVLFFLVCFCLATISSVKPISGPDYTTRFNLYRSVEVTGAPAAGYTSDQARQALKEVAEETLPQDMSYAWNAMSFQEEKASGSLMMILVFSLVFVFLILAAQYESWSLPLSILLGTPFAIFGALFALWVGRLVSPTFENNIFAQVSFVMLIGMAAKNAMEFLLNMTLLFCDTMKQKMERKKSEELLLKEKQYLEAVFNSLAEGIVSCDENGILNSEIVFINNLANIFLKQNLMYVN